MDVVMDVMEILPEELPRVFKRNHSLSIVKTHQSIEFHFDIYAHQFHFDIYVHAFGIILIYMNIVIV